MRTKLRLTRGSPLKRVSPSLPPSPPSPPSTNVPGMMAQKVANGVAFMAMRV